MPTMWRAGSTSCKTLTRPTTSTPADATSGVRAAVVALRAQSQSGNLRGGQAVAGRSLRHRRRPPRQEPDHSRLSSHSLCTPAPTCWHFPCGATLRAAPNPCSAPPLEGRVAIYRDRLSTGSRRNILVHAEQVLRIVLRFHRCEPLVVLPIGR